MRSAPCLDIVRHGVLLRCAQRTDRTLSALLLGKRGNARAIADLDRLRAILGGHAPAALCDLPWVPLYLCVLFLLHPLFGLLAAMGGVLPVACLIIGERRSARPGAAGGTIERAAVGVCPPRGSSAARTRWLLANARLREAQDASVWPTLVTAAVLRVATRGASIGDAGAWRLPRHVRNLPRAGDARRIDHTCPRPRPCGVGDRTLAQPGGSTRQRPAALHASRGRDR